jgi:hypothetical protein
MFKKKPTSEEYQILEDIIINFCSREEVRKMVYPGLDVNDYILQDEDNQVNILIKSGRVHITNHKFLINKEVPLKVTEKLKKIVREQLEKERQQLIKQLFDNEMELLTKIKEL